MAGSAASPRPPGSPSSVTRSRSSSGCPSWAAPWCRRPSAPTPGTPPTSTLLPAVVRDLFRKSGRPVERELELVPLELVREHVFEDASVVRLPGESRAAQIAAFDGLSPGLGQQWVDHVASYADDWEVLRRAYLEVPWTPAALPKEVAARLDSREVLHRRLKKRFKDERLRQVAAHPFVADGHDPRNVPAWAGLVAYLEQRFGAWTVEGGMGVLATALTDRLATRRVTVETRRGRRGRRGPRGQGGRRPHLGRRGRRGRRRGGRRPAAAAGAGVVRRAHHALDAAGRLPRRAGGRAPGAPGGDAARDGAARRPDARRPDRRHRARRGTRPGRSTGAAGWPRTSCAPWPGTASTCGPTSSSASTAPRARWSSTGAARRSACSGRAGRRSGSRLGPETPVRGVYAAGAHATPGGGLPFVGLSAALVAQAVGPA